MTTTLTIRPTTRADIAAIDLLLSRSYPILLKPDYKPSVMVTALPLISKANPRLLQSGTYYAVQDETGQIVGAGGWCHRNPMGGPGREGLGHIRHVVTDFRYTRRGIGNALVNHIFETAKAAGIRQLDCLSTLTAEPFYAALGFRRIGDVELSLVPGIRFPAVQMTLQLG